MNWYWLFSVYIFLIFFDCEVSGFNALSNASTSASETVHTVKDAFDIKKEIAEIAKKRKEKKRGKKRTRRYSTGLDVDPSAAINKFSSTIEAFLKTYIYQPIAHGNFLEAPIRSYPRTFDTPERKFVFGTLDGELNQSFRSVMKDRHPRTGDIISCRIPTDRMAEHYMMVINSQIAEVGVVGGKNTHNGVIKLDSYRKSSYINSTECLYHENRVIARAEQIADETGSDTEAILKYKQILDRFKCTVSGNNTEHFNYDIVYCNCQDLVMYWAYGYVETRCLELYFNGCSQYLRNPLYAISDYVDVSGQLRRNAEQLDIAMMNNPVIG